MKCFKGFVLATQQEENNANPPVDRTIGSREAVKRAVAELEAEGVVTVEDEELIKDFLFWIVGAYYANDRGNVRRMITVETPASCGNLHGYPFTYKSIGFGGQGIHSTAVELSSTVKLTEDGLVFSDFTDAGLKEDLAYVEKLGGSVHLAYLADAMIGKKESVERILKANEAVKEALDNQVNAVASGFRHGGAAEVGLLSVYKKHGPVRFLNSKKEVLIEIFDNVDGGRTQVRVPGGRRKWVHYISEGLGNTVEYFELIEQKEKRK